MQYKVGDKVVVKPWAMMEAQYGLNKNGCINTKDGDGLRCTITRTMYSRIDGNGTVEIALDEDGIYRLLEDDNTWPSDAFLGLHFELGEKIEVSDDGEGWRNGEFWGYSYAPNATHLIRSSNYWFKKARKIQPKLTITVEINGKEVDPKELSDESWMALKR